MIQLLILTNGLVVAIYKSPKGNEIKIMGISNSGLIRW